MKRLAFFLAIGLVFCGVVWLALRPSGLMSAVYDLDGYDPVVSQVFPLGRLTEPVKTPTGWQQEILAEPIYFYARVPRAFESADVTVWLSGNYSQPIRLGLLSDEAYEFHDLNSTRPLDTVSQPFTAQVDLRHARLENGSYRFLLSVPRVGGVDSNLFLQKIEADLVGKPLTVGELVRKAWNHGYPF